MVLDNTSKAVHVTDASDASTDWAVDAASHPTVYIHSATTPATEYIKMYHDATNAYIDAVGATTLQLLVAGTAEVSVAAASVSPTTTNGAALGTTSLQWSDLFLASGGVINWDGGEITLTHVEVGKLVVAATWATAAATGRPWEVDLTVNAALGSYSNAIKGYVVYGTSGRTTGLGSAINAEILLSAGTSSGTYAPLESEIVINTNGLTGTATGFLYCNATGTAASTFDTNGYLFMIGTGITPAAGKFASLHSQTLKALIEANTRYVVTSQMEDGVGLGNSTTSMTLTTYANHAIEVYTTSASADTSNNVEPIYMKSTMTGAGGVGGRARFHLYVTAALGGWSNALKGYAEYATTGSTTGLGTAVCAETLLSTGTTTGTYAALEGELVANSAVSTGTATSFIYMNIAGSNSTGKTTLNTNGYLFELGAGVVDTSSGMFDVVTKTPTSVEFDANLKIRIGGVDYFIPLSADNAFE